MSRIDENFDLQAYMTRGVENVVADALKATFKDPKESAFMLRFAAATKAASKRRADAEAAPEPVATADYARRYARWRFLTDKLGEWAMDERRC